MLVKRLFPKKTVVPKLSLREFHDKRNKIIIVRNARGIGDILMHRMIFEDFKRLMPEMHLTFACPKQYHPLTKHPFVDAVIDSTVIDCNKYGTSYDTSSCCIKWENAHAPHADKHRADLWAEHCGVALTNHDMHLPFLDEKTMRFGRAKVQQLGNVRPKILFTPLTFCDQRTLTDDQIISTVKYLHTKGLVYSTHQTEVNFLERLGVPVLAGYDLLHWLSFIHAADYVVTADTSVFHYAGGIRKPMTAVFTHVDGKARGRYFDFVLVQKHRDNGNWPCGPCYNYAMCTHPKCSDKKDFEEPRPCLTELTVAEIIAGLEEMFTKWPLDRICHS